MKEGFDWPLMENRIRRSSLSHTFGMVRHNSDGSTRAHQGWDFYAPEGTDIFPCADGKIAFAGERGDLGLMLLIAHSPQLFSVYAHLSHIVETGSDRLVAKNQPVAKTGKTGNAHTLKGEERHLHFELRTLPFPGLGLFGRLDPMIIFDICPLHQTAYRAHAC